MKENWIDMPKPICGGIYTNPMLNLELNLEASSNGMFDMMFSIQYAQHQMGEKPDKFGT